MQEKKAGANHTIVDAQNESVMNRLRLSDAIIREKESIKYLESNLSDTARTDMKNKYPCEKQGKKAMI